jgi:hypothetical protein
LLRARSLVGRSDAERHCYDWRGGNLRRARGYLRGVILVCAVARGNGSDWTIPCYLPWVGQTVIQPYTPAEFRGRTMAIFT